MKHWKHGVAALGVAVLMALTVSAAASELPGHTENRLTTASQPPAGTVSELELNWHCGYVSSADNQNVAEVGVYPDMATYSYSDVFTVPRAGTKIYFTDDNVDCGGVNGFASYRTYVFSEWKQVKGEWVLDPDGCNLMGTAEADSTIAKVIQLSTGTAVEYTYVTSKDNENLRICYCSGEKAGNKVKYSTVYSVYTGEEGTAVRLEREKEALRAELVASRDTVCYPVLDGKELFVIGDSYLGGVGLDADFRWPALLAAKYGMEMTNYGINGSTISAYNMVDVSRAPMCLRWQNMPEKAPDILLIEGGRNDFSVGAPIGDVHSTDITTYMGALNSMINGLQKKYPDTLIVCATVWAFPSQGTNTLGNYHNDYGNAMRELCAYRGIPCFNAMDQQDTQVYMNSQSFREQYCMSSTDISHLNREGMELVMPSFERFLGEQLTRHVEAQTHTLHLSEIAQQLKISGRYSLLESGITCDFTASGIEFCVQGKGKLLLNVQSLGENYFTLYVDGVRQDTRYQAVNGLNVLELAELDGETHTIRLVKQSENAYARCVLRSLTVSGALLEPPAQKELYLEFLGDSITCGYGILTTGAPAGISSSLYEDGTQAFAYLAAELFGADASMVSCSGIGVTSGYVPYRMQDFYTALSYSRNEKQPYQPIRIPDAVVINLGTNDATMRSDTEQFVTDLKALISTVRGYYGESVPIVWCCNMMNDGYISLIRQTLTELGGEPEGLYLLELVRDQNGGNNHPSPEAHQRAAQTLADYLRKLLLPE